MRLVPMAISLFALIGLSVPLAAEWKSVAANQDVRVAGKLMLATPGEGWNTSTARPSDRSERWTRDGLALNELTFFAGVADGEALYFVPAGISKDLPTFRSGMLPTDVVELFEASNRIVLGSSVFAVDNMEPAKLGDHDAVRFSYRYAAQDEGLTRKGEGVAAIVGGQLYLVNFIAPAVHYFERDIAEVRQLIAGVQLHPPKAAEPK
ncbi:hypothetical protein DXH95_04730 [Sphingorhabdus pulchriflava]|uniref:Uncharacterized protein n=1 Tax=Sphingorhabdus pulchriflava TaxID=2292257 RepID=A0A371BGJ5_9SPHN|nr:hypothetical protein [Sphingorhabdus pulchriflava]RDV06716.1 hypothetical protein DXH95_04730 [Sphingorhabdus pulchriflava]